MNIYMQYKEYRGYTEYEAEGLLYDKKKDLKEYEIIKDDFFITTIEKLKEQKFNVGIYKDYELKYIKDDKFLLKINEESIVEEGKGEEEWFYYGKYRGMTMTIKEDCSTLFVAMSPRKCPYRVNTFISYHSCKLIIKEFKREDMLEYMKAVKFLNKIEERYNALDIHASRDYKVNKKEHKLIKALYKICKKSVLILKD